MKKSCYLILVFCFFTLFFACSVDTTKDITKDTRKPYFWQVEKRGKVSYLLGTIHIVVPLDELSCSDVIQEKLKNSDLLFVESIKQKSEIHLDLISPNREDFNRLSRSNQAFLIEKGVPSTASCTTSNRLLNLLCLKEVFGESSLEIKMDEEAQSIAKNYGILMKPLDEDIESQIKTVFTCERLEKSIENYPICLETIRDSVDAYRTSSLTSEQISVDNNVSDILLKERNKQWFLKFESAHGKYNHIFVAAGLAHFIGHFNFIDILKENGFSVERVSCQK